LDTFTNFEYIIVQVTPGLYGQLKSKLQIERRNTTTEERMDKLIEEMEEGMWDSEDRRRKEIERWDKNGWSRCTVVFEEPFGESENKRIVEMSIRDEGCTVFFEEPFDATEYKKEVELGEKVRRSGDNCGEVITSPQRNKNREKEKLIKLQNEIKYEKRKTAKALKRREGLEESENHMKHIMTTFTKRARSI